MRIVIATVKTWNISNAIELQRNLHKDMKVEIITEQEQLNYDYMSSFNPTYIFFPHWSWIIPETIYENFSCVVFHMTDLPFGRGGSPLQNLIEMGIENTKISAIVVEKEIDSGSIYLKNELNLNGSAEEILIRASSIIFNQMIPEIIKNQPTPRRQEGEITEFERRKPAQSELKQNVSMKQLYDHIRMLDGEGYPKAYIQFGNYKLFFSRASLKHDRIITDVEIMEDYENE